mmetsp:Transcript_10669/g.21488  ORF Transcript_10669/g.21488 Transcript_10669/m.21488 type:complete len:133 (-) Transcript_10669:894-1292(-)
MSFTVWEYSSARDAVGMTQSGTNYCPTHSTTHVVTNSIAWREEAGFLVILRDQKTPFAVERKADNLAISGTPDSTAMVVHDTKSIAHRTQLSSQVPDDNIVITAVSMSVGGILHDRGIGKARVEHVQILVVL